MGERLTCRGTNIHALLFISVFDLVLPMRLSSIDIASLHFEFVGELLGV